MAQRCNHMKTQCLQQYILTSEWVLICWSKILFRLASSSLLVPALVKSNYYNGPINASWIPWTVI